MSVNFGDDHPDSLPIPDCLRVAPSTEPAEWVIESLWPWWQGGFKVGCLVPSTYEAFARIAHDGVGEGSLPRNVVRSLEPLLGRHSTSDRAWYAVWNGWGTFGPGVSFGPLRATRRTRAERAENRQLFERIQAALARVPQLRIPGRAYYLFVGSIGCAASLEISGMYQSASMWWAADRAWFLATEVDASFTIVGASRACIDEITSSLYATEVRAGDLIVWENPRE